MSVLTDWTRFLNRFFEVGKIRKVHTRIILMEQQCDVGE
jgi:hypothetical protein